MTIPEHYPMELPAELLQRTDHLLGILSGLRRTAVAMSGGVDSAVMAMAAYKALGDSAVALTADSPSVARSDLSEARRVAEFIGIRHLVIPTNEFENASYTLNDGSRCYHCKSELYSRIEKHLPELGIDTICSGANLDDAGDYRPGLVAAAEHQVRHPLQEAGFTKSAVRELAKFWRLPVWDKPASPCLASRLVPGLRVTVERTSRVEQAEAFLHSLGLRTCRVRHHEADLARIEVESEHLARLAETELRNAIATRFQQLGFRYVTLDLIGFRSGNLNELIALDVKARYVKPLGVKGSQR